MLKFEGKQTCITNLTRYEGLFTHDRGTETLVIKDPLITDPAIAADRAKSEFLKGGYSERWISITTLAVVGLKQNDIVSFAGEQWIVKEIALSFSPPVLLQTIKGVRYE